MLYVQNQKPFMYIGTTRAGAAAEQFRVFLTGLLQDRRAALLVGHFEALSFSDGGFGGVGFKVWAFQCK